MSSFWLVLLRTMLWSNTAVSATKENAVIYPNNILRCTVKVTTVKGAGLCGDCVFNVVSTCTVLPKKSVKGRNWCIHRIYLQQSIRGQIHGAPSLHGLHPAVPGPSLRLRHGICPGQRSFIILHQPASSFSSAFPLVRAGAALPGQERPSFPRLPLLTFEWRRTTHAVPAWPPAGPAAPRAPRGMGRRAPGTGLQKKRAIGINKKDDM